MHEQSDSFQTMEAIRDLPVVRDMDAHNRAALNRQMRDMSHTELTAMQHELKSRE